MRYLLALVLVACAPEPCPCVQIPRVESECTRAQPPRRRPPENLPLCREPPAPDEENDD